MWDFVQVVVVVTHVLEIRFGSWELQQSGASAAGAVGHSLVPQVGRLEVTSPLGSNQVMVLGSRDLDPKKFGSMGPAVWQVSAWPLPFGMGSRWAWATDRASAKAWEEFLGLSFRAFSKEEGLVQLYGPPSLWVGLLLFLCLMCLLEVGLGCGKGSLVFSKWTFRPRKCGRAPLCMTIAVRQVFIPQGSCHLARVLGRREAEPVEAPSGHGFGVGPPWTKWTGDQPSVGVSRRKLGLGFCGLSVPGPRPALELGLTSWQGLELGLARSTRYKEFGREGERVPRVFPGIEALIPMRLINGNLGCLKVLIEKVMTPLPLVGKILKVKSLANMFKLKMKVPRQRASPSGSVGVAVASASEELDIRVGVPLSMRNILTEVKLVELWTNFSVPPSVGLRLPSAADVVRYLPEGCVLIFTDMYQHGFRLPFHPWVQMMLAKLGYASGQYNPNFWILLHGVKERGYFIGHKPSTQKSWRNRWCLAYGDLECHPGKTVSKHIPTHFQSIGSVKWGPISKEQEDEVKRVRSLLSETERECKNLVTQKNLLESSLLQGMADIIKGSTKVAVDLDEVEIQKRLRKSRAKRAEKGGAKQVTGKRPRDDDEGLVADVLGKKKAQLEAHRSVMRTEPRLPPFDLQAPPKLPFGIEDTFVEGVEKVDFSVLRQQKKEVNLAMHRQEVPLVNVFLEGVKSDPRGSGRRRLSRSWPLFSQAADRQGLIEFFWSLQWLQQEEFRRSFSSSIRSR
ncbi:unnamed protein product [Prunus armeniaca]